MPRPSASYFRCIADSRRRSDRRDTDDAPHRQFGLRDSSTIHLEDRAALEKDLGHFPAIADRLDACFDEPALEFYADPQILRAERYERDSPLDTFFARTRCDSRGFLKRCIT